MKLITRKSECRPLTKYGLVKTPKEANRMALSDFVIKDGVIVKAYFTASDKEAVIVSANYCDDEMVKLEDGNSFMTIGN